MKRRRRRATGLGDQRIEPEPASEQNFSQSAATLVAKIEQLPPLPSLATKSITMLSDPDSPLEAVEKVIAKDQALVTTIIKVSNSALYGGLQKVTSLRQALTRLGAKTTKSLILAASARGYFINQRQGIQVWGQMLWQHAVECALAARQVAAVVHYADPDEAFISGIMHDIGKVAVLMLYPEQYKQIQKLKSQEKLTDLEAERRTIQTDHAHIGQLLMAKWYLPEAVRACTECHHRPAEAGAHIQLAGIVAYGNHLSHVFGEHPQADAVVQNPDTQELVALLGLSDEAAQKIAAAVQNDFQSTELMAD